MQRPTLAAIAFLAASVLTIPARADLITVANHSFEDTTGQTVFNEFTFGTPVGWQIYDPFAIQGTGVFTGTLEPNGIEFFNSTAPDGNLVGILFNSQREGDGEYGFEQTLTDVLMPDTTYSLDVEVGNIASGTATNGTFFNLDEFPGYRVELLAGGIVIAEDLNSLSIPEGEFLTSTVSFTTGAAHPQLGMDLGIRLVNLNAIPAGFTQATSPDLEVDFDNVRLTTTAIPEPAGTGFALFLLTTIAFRRQR
ncbi:MAG: hypothetical protein AAF456_24415 [Planctomycetota bacterium]